MKILSAKQVYKADQATIKSLSISSTELMEKAGLSCFNRIYRALQNTSNPVHVFCGMGNNGGDGLVISRLLAKKAIDVRTYLVNFSDKRSDDFLINLKRLEERNISLYEINNKEDFPDIQSNDLIIDAIFGIGLSRPIEGFTGELIQKLNTSKAAITSIDIPSGLSSDNI